MFCEECGKKIPDNVEFCPECGTKVKKEPAEASAQPEPAVQQESEEKAAETAEKFTAEETQEQFSFTPVRLGFSNKINDPAFGTALKKNAKATLIFGIVLILLPIIITLIIAISKSDMKILAGGAFISAVFLVFWVVSAIKEKAKRQWDGTVISKRIEHRKVRNRDEYTDMCIIDITTDNGRKKKIEEKKGFTKYYSYLQPGDRIRFHPRFTNYYEKYDKTHDQSTFCPVCGKMVPLSQDRCSCGVPVLK